MFWEIVKLVVSFALILLAIVYVIKYGLTRLQPGYNRTAACLQVVERMPLGPKNGLCLIRMGERFYLLGVSSDSINLLAEVDGKDIDRGLTREMQQQKSCSNGFKEKLQALMKKKFAGGLPFEENRNE